MAYFLDEIPIGYKLIKDRYTHIKRGDMRWDIWDEKWVKVSSDYVGRPRVIWPSKHFITEKPMTLPEKTKVFVNKHIQNPTPELIEKFQKAFEENFGS